MKLFTVELKRFWSRRITWLTMVIVGLFMVLGVGIGFTQASSDPPTGGVVVDQSCLNAFIGFRDNDNEPEFQGMSDDELGRTFCSESDQDRRFFATLILGQSQVQDWSDSRLEAERTDTVRVGGEEYERARFGLEGIVPGISTFLLVIAVVLGGSFVGAEYRSGTVENLLLWEPRRIRVMLTKYGAGLVSAAVVLAIMASWLTGLLLLLARFRGSFQGMEPAFWVDWVAMVGRASLIAGLFFVLAMAIATLAKNTTAAVVALLGWFVVSNILIELLAKWFRQYELFTNAAAFIGQGDVARYVGSGNQQTLVFSHGYWMAAIAVLVWAAVPGAIALAVFRRRDIS